ncbi:hypothetical protein SAMN06296065_102451 [Novosphingobium panipatense]|uniref:Uncharacterized protein n=1 Tax=Novosphingobium panipatense TaxID=428991 RepID=A0ABY1Q4D1_9SPHN|nr:hypothetical protein SAMN06296065_102451 [Novosphingobium panipatense]
MSLTSTKVGAYIVEGAPPGPQASKVSQMLVSGPFQPLTVSRIGYYLVTAPPKDPRRRINFIP